MPVKPGFNQNILLPSGMLYPRYITRCSQGASASSSGGQAGIYLVLALEGESQHLGPSRCAAAPPQAFLLPQRSGSLLRFSLLCGQATRADLSWDLLPAFWQDPGGAPGIFQFLLLCSRSLLHCQLAWHRPGTQLHVQPVGQGLEFLFMLPLALTCQGCHEK